MKLKKVLILISLGFLLVLALDFGVNAFTEPVVPFEVQQLVITALEDNSWLSLKTEQDFRIYCESIYSEEMVEQMAASLFYFVQENNDWHTVAKVRSLRLTDRSPQCLTVQATVDNLDIQLSDDNLPQDYISGQASYLITVVKENNLYKIADIEESRFPVISAHIL